MAQVKITLTCSQCGKEFEHVHFCCNSKEAKSYTEWAKDNVDTCPSCYYANKKADEDELINDYINGHHLPDITGVSDKQIDYASKVRTAFIKRLCKAEIDLNRFFRIADAIQLDKASERDRAKIDKLAQQSGQTVTDWFSEYRSRKIAHLMGHIDKTIIAKIETAFNERNAQKNH